MGDYAHVCALVPTYNEAATIEEVVTGLQTEGFEHVLVVDGHSTDGTRNLAADAGAEVITQSKGGHGSGKGQAVREGVAYTDKPYVVMLDGDGTYRPEDAHDVLHPVYDGRVDHVVGDRFADMEPGAMPKLNQFGNWMINRGFGVIHRQHLGDILSGYRAFTRESFLKMNLNADGFGIETEMAVESLRNDQTVTVVDITYLARPDSSESNLRPFRDGGGILLTLYLRAKTHNPLFYFGSIGGILALTGTILGIYIAVDWFTRSAVHLVLTPTSGILLVLGVQFLIFGVLADLLVTLHEEQRHQLERIASTDQHATDTSDRTDDAASDRTDDADESDDSADAGDQTTDAPHAEPSDASDDD